MSCDLYDATQPKGQKWCYFFRKTTKRRRDRAEGFVALEPALTPFVEVFQRAGAKAVRLKRKNKLHQTLNKLDVLLQALRLQEVVGFQSSFTLSPILLFLYRCFSKNDIMV